MYMLLNKRLFQNGFHCEIEHRDGRRTTGIFQAVFCFHPYGFISGIIKKFTASPCKTYGNGNNRHARPNRWTVAKYESCINEKVNVKGKLITRNAFQLLDRTIRLFDGEHDFFDGVKVSFHFSSLS